MCLDSRTCHRSHYRAFIIWARFILWSLGQHMHHAALTPAPILADLTPGLMLERPVECPVARATDLTIDHSPDSAPGHSV